MSELPSTPDQEAALLTMNQAIEQLATTRATFNRWLRAGRIKGFKVGRQWRFKREDIDRFLAGGTPRIDLKVSPEPLLGALSRFAGLDNGEEASITASARSLVLAAIATGARYFHADILGHEGGVRGVIRFRIDGLIQEVCTYDARLHEPLVEELKRFAALDVTDTTRPQSGQYPIRISAEKSVRAIISVVRSALGSCLSGQIVDPAAAEIDFEVLGLTGASLGRIKEALARRDGLVIASGPSDSGKLVTAYSMLHHTKTGELRTITVEDRLEVGLQNAVQLKVDESQGLDYPTLIRAAVTMDPDVLMVKSIRDEPTFMESLDVALARLVIGTMHASDAVSGLVAMHNWGARGLQLSEALNLVTSQRLVRRLCSVCRQPAELSEEEDALLARVCAAHGLPGMPEGQFASPVGCERCRGTGFFGRIGIFEALAMSPEIESALRTDLSYRDLLRTAIAGGMETLCLDGLRRAAEGVTTVREVQRVAADLVEYH